MKYNRISITLFFCILFSSFILKAQDSKPNVLLIMTDQQAWNAVGYAGNSTVKTPNLDKLASEGVNFSQAVTPCAVCAPARTSILTGRLIETTTIRGNNDVKSADCFYPTFDEILAKKGFVTEVYGKFHSPEHMARVYMNPPIKGMSGTDPIVKWESIYVKYIQKNFSKRALKLGELYETSFYGGTVAYKVDPTDRYYKYLPSGIIPKEEQTEKLSQADVHGVLDLPADFTITAVQGKQTIAALERLKNKPFMLTASFHCPHVPITPSEPYASMYKAANMPTPVTISDKRENSPYNPGKIESPYNEKDKVQFMTANYYAFVTEVDDWVGKILNKLDELKLLDNTLVLFVSDHGEMLGAHGMRGKFNFYEESVRVPFLVRFPGKIKAGQTISNPVSTLNIYPTILDYAGLKSFPSDGYSLRGIMEGTETPKYDFAVSEWDWKNANVPSLMIRTSDWKLMTTHRSGGKNVEVLYDLKNDPYEINNLLGTNPDRFKYKDQAEQLRSKLVHYLKENNYPHSKGVEERILIREQ